MDVGLGFSVSVAGGCGVSVGGYGCMGVDVSVGWCKRIKDSHHTQNQTSPRQVVQELIFSLN